MLLVIRYYFIYNRNTINAFINNRNLYYFILRVFNLTMYILYYIKSLKNVHVSRVV